MGKDNWPRVAVEKLTVHTIFPLLLPGLLFPSGSTSSMRLEFNRGPIVLR